MLLCQFSTEYLVSISNLYIHSFLFLPLNAYLQRILNRTIRAEGFSCTTVKDLYVAITSISSWYINQGNSQYTEQIEKM